LFFGAMSGEYRIAFALYRAAKSSRRGLDPRVPAFANCGVAVNPCGAEDTTDCRAKPGEGECTPIDCKPID
jgi:hypothetical protein